RREEDDVQPPFDAETEALVQVLKHGIPRREMRVEVEAGASATVVPEPDPGRRYEFEVANPSPVTPHHAEIASDRGRVTEWRRDDRMELEPGPAAVRQPLCRSGDPVRQEHVH